MVWNFMYSYYTMENDSMINKLMKSVLDQERSAVVLCDLNHTIVYMNDAAAERYAGRGGRALIGQSLLKCHNDKSNEMIDKIVKWFMMSTDNNMIYTFRNEKENKDVYMVALRDDDKTLIGYYEKHEYRNIETASLYDFDNPVK